MSVSRTCVQCGAVFFAYPAPVAKGKARFCSLSCSQASRNKQVDAICVQCGASYRCRSELAGIRRFCSQACHYAAKRTSVIKACQRCGNMFEVRPHEFGKRAFCSSDCIRPLVNHPSDPTAILVPLTKNYFAVIDAEDAPLVSTRNWYALCERRTIYAASGHEKLRLHHVLLPRDGDFIVDHIDGDGLNNRRSNLRSATPLQNSMNQRLRRDSKTGFRGVSKRKEKFVAGIGRTSRLHLGQFSTADEAAAAYDEAARRIHGEFARLNFPGKGEQKA